MSVARSRLDLRDGGMISLSIRVDVPDHYQALARWAIVCLLEPLGIVPNFTSGSGGVSDVYYGRDYDGSFSTLSLPYSTEAASLFGDWSSYDGRSVAWREWEGERWPLFFLDAEGHADIVASAALILSGWEEVKTRARDHKGRFRYADSLQARNGFTCQPVVDAYREWLAERLDASGLPVDRRTWGSHDWALCVTVDIDYARKWRPGMIYREVVEHLLLNRRREETGLRLERFGLFLSDFLRPGDVYAESLGYILDKLSSCDGAGTFFVKAGAHGPNDVAYSLRNKRLRHLLNRAVDCGYEIGVHPSYYASAHPRYMTEELSAVRALTVSSPRAVRQHYLRYELPVTLRLHEAAGFEIDSTIGFAEHEGFRRGTCLPHRIFDLHANCVSNVWEMPLVFMDSTLFNRRGYSVEEAVEATRSIMRRCRRFRGCAVALWHNVIRDPMDAHGWDRHFDDTLDTAIEDGALVSGLSRAFDDWLASR